MTRSADPRASGRTPMRVAVVGNPNVGKTSLFNVLTDSRHHVGNYPGITVETRDGSVASRYAASRPITLVDLPGIYSLTAFSEDEAVAFRALEGALGPAPDAILLVLDASNLARNLYLASQILELDCPVVVALNMVDVAEQAGLAVDPERLARELGVAVVPTVARTGRGCPQVVEALQHMAGVGGAPRRLEVPTSAVALTQACAALETVVSSARARWLLTCAAANALERTGASSSEREALSRLPAATVDRAARELITRRYQMVDEILGAVGLQRVVRERAPVMDRSRQIDRVLTHRLWGTLVFVLVMAVVFQAIFSWAEPLMQGIEAAMGWLAEKVATGLGPGLLTDLITDGVIAGAGNVIVFLPQIAMLFLFIGLLEDTGYLARAAFLMDRLMSRVGLHGRAFVPLLSGYACAIPAILGTRTISGFKDRVVAILMIPFMSCSARLPIYALVIGAFFETDRRVFGPFTEGGLMLLAMYGLSTLSALGMGFVYKRTLLRSPTPPLVLELPPYRFPRLRNTLLVVYDRSMDFVRSAGTVILACTVVLWAMLSFPREDTGAGSGGATEISASYAGRLGRAMEPALEPMGQDWRMGIGLIGSFAAREVLVSTLGLVYGMEADDENQVSLREAIRSDRDPETGELEHTPRSGLALMVFFVYACQCMSTLAVVQRETRSWRWPLFMFVSMTAMAYVAAVLVFQVGGWLGFA